MAVVKMDGRRKRLMVYKVQAAPGSGAHMYNTD